MLLLLQYIKYILSKWTLGYWKRKCEVIMDQGNQLNFYLSLSFIFLFQFRIMFTRNDMFDLWLEIISSWNDEVNFLILILSFYTNNSEDFFFFIYSRTFDICNRNVIMIHENDGFSIYISNGTKLFFSFEAITFLNRDYFFHHPNKKFL